MLLYIYECFVGIFKLFYQATRVRLVVHYFGNTVEGTEQTKDLQFVFAIEWRHYRVVL